MQEKDLNTAEYDGRLYYTDSHLKEFTAVVTDVQPAEDGYLAVLDRTAFFPEGGGQFGDVGTLNGIAVTDTIERGGVIYHRIAEPLETGTEVTGRVDWAVRFDRMQQHSGEHIVSGLVHRHFGYDNVGFHLGDAVTTLDFNGPLTDEDIRMIENEANGAVYKNIPFKVTFPTKEEEAGIDYRSKIDIQGQVRLVEAEGYDLCACCAPHVNLAGEIGCIRIVDAIHYKGGMRLTMLCGRRALNDYRAKTESVTAIGRLLSVPAEETADTVARLKESAALTREHMLNWQERYLLSQIPECAEGMQMIFDSGADKNIARKIVNTMIERGAAVACAFTGDDEGGYNYIVACAEGGDARIYSKKLQEAFGARGGGKPEMVQGTVKAAEAGIRNAMMI